MPRWRPLSRTPSYELSCEATTATPTVSPTRHFEAALRRWSSDQTLVNAVEAYDAAIVTSDAKATEELAKWIAENGSDATHAIYASATGVLAPKHLQSDDSHEGHIGGDRPFQIPISKLKKRLIESPRDAISACELSRLYTVTGQRRKAIHWIERALILAPDNRYILRSAAQLFSHYELPDQALDLIWRSTIVRFDPWVQAAEVAVADSAGRSPKWAHKQRARIAASESTISSSELALGLASLEEKAGTQRRLVRRLVERGLARPTENALAQAVWLGVHRGLTLTRAPVSLNTIGFAGEAKALQALEAGHFATALAQCDEWIRDEPYSVPAHIMAGVCAGAYMDEHDRAIKYYEDALRLSPQNWRIFNGLVLSCVYMNYLERAETYQAKFEECRHIEEALPYLHAARGLIAFRKKDLQAGRLHYTEALAITCKDVSGVDLVAKIYWIEQEASYGTIDPEHWNSFRDYIEKNIEKISPHNRGHVRSIWNARKNIIDLSCSNKSNKLEHSLFPKIFNHLQI